MAFWYRKGSRVYVYHRLRGRQEQVPRTEVRHLDIAPDAEIDRWVWVWEQQHGGSRGPEHIVLGEGPLAQRLVQYERHLRGDVRGLDPLTVDRQMSDLRLYVVPYFVGVHGLQEPTHWPSVSYGLYDWVVGERGQSMVKARDVGLSLRNLWTWMRHGSHAVPGHLELGLPTLRGVHNRATRLKRPVSPGIVLRFLQGQRDPTIRALCILQYFFSLRPQETFDLHRGDFVVGKAARKEDASKAMVRAGRYADLLVFVERQRSPRAKDKVPKEHSYGFVACFSKLAATWMVALLNDPAFAGGPDADPDTPLFRGDVRELYRQWATARKGTTLEGLSLKDLRRASIHWLGHGPMSATELDLCNHARHKDINTTRLYMRNPRRRSPRSKGRFDLGNGNGHSL